MILDLDLETYSELDLKVVGTYRYAKHCEILLFLYAIDDGPVQVWDVASGAAMPADLAHALVHAREVTAHNAQFDKAVIAAQLPALAPALSRWRCTMAQALSHALPGSLSDLCAALRVPEDQVKLKEERKLIGLFCQPQPANRKIRRATAATHPAEWARFVKYGVQDVVAMRECRRRMPTWNWDAAAIAEWHCDQRINERGFYVDRELTEAGVRAAVTEKQRIGVRFRELTSGCVDRPSLRDQFKAYLNLEFGLGLADTRSETFQQLLKKDLPPRCAELMQLSIASNKTSTAKYAALNPAIGSDNRFRGGLQFAGAGRTRRWAGRIFQPQNLPSRGLPDADSVEQYIEMLKLDAHALFFGDDLMRYGAAALRGVVIAPPGKELAVADLSNIEGRMLAWVADEQWKLAAFREYDAGTGPDLYNVTAVSIIGGDPWKVEKKNRNVFGKVPDLASGYQGGVAGYQTFAKAYGVRMADYWDVIQRMIAEVHVVKARENLEQWGRKQLDDLEISETEWLASETCKLAWRARHPATVKFWYALQDAMKNAIAQWGLIFNAGRYIKVRGVEHAGLRWLVVRLPNGRCLTYFDPRLVDAKGNIALAPDVAQLGRLSITYMGEASEQGSTTRAWIRVWTHGGKATGNVCQTLARDQLAPALQEAEDAGMPPVLSVHDEVISEVDEGRGYDDLSRIMSTNRWWNPGLPLAAAGFSTRRYKKD